MNGRRSKQRIFRVRNKRITALTRLAICVAVVAFAACAYLIISDAASIHTAPTAIHTLPIAFNGFI